MENQEKQPYEIVGEMCKRRETMADGKRYIIFYTFESQKETSGGADEFSLPVSGKDEVSENV